MDNFEIENIHFSKNTIVVDWYGKIGWGELTIHKNEKGEFEIETETLGEDFAKACLSKVVTFICEKGIIVE